MKFIKFETKYELSSSWIIEGKEMGLQNIAKCTFVSSLS